MRIFRVVDCQLEAGFHLWGIEQCSLWFGPISRGCCILVKTGACVCNSLGGSHRRVDFSQPVFCATTLDWKSSLCRQELSFACIARRFRYRDVDTPACRCHPFWLLLWDVSFRNGHRCAARSVACSCEVCVLDRFSTWPLFEFESEHRGSEYPNSGEFVNPTSIRTCALAFRTARSVQSLSF